MNDFQISILGCGSALPTTRHYATSQIIHLRNKLYMIDCGEGTQVQMRRMRFRFGKLTHIFISHLHGDHCFGLPGLLSTFNLLERNGTLTIHAPKEIDKYLLPILDMFGKEFSYTLNINYIDTNSYSLILEDNSVKVYSIPLRHRIPTCGFLFEEKQKEASLIKEMADFYNIPVSFLKDIKKGMDYITPEGEIITNNRLTRPAPPARKYAYCSDTLFSPEIVPFIKGADLLYHEATFTEADLKRAKNTFHSTARQAAEIARMAEVKKLIIGHFSARYEDETILQEEADVIFPDTILAKEEMTLTI